MHRRRFLHHSLSLSAGVALASSLPAADTEPLPVLDTHQHLWDVQKFRLPWIKKGDSFDRNYLLSDYLEATKGLNVVKAIYMEVDVDPAQHVAEAEYVIGICQRADAPTVAAVIGGRPASDDFGKYLARFKDSAYVKGVRQVLHGTAPAGTCLDKAFIRGVQLLGEMGLSFDLCMRPGELLDAAKLIDACPGTRFILDHCGNGDVQAKDLEPWKKGIAEVAKRKGVMCKVSGIVVNATPGKWTADDLAPVIKHTLAVFGPDRVMFGGDWPVCTRAASFNQWLTALQQIVADRPRAEQRRLFHDNAARFYGVA
jgi:predicted TIM-barrel fold metal-dependent hydrolase